MPPTSSALIRAFGNPLRQRILQAYLDGSIKCATTREVASALDQPAEKVAYHLKTLAENEILRPVQERDGRQAHEARYALGVGVEGVWLRVMLQLCRRPV